MGTRPFLESATWNLARYVVDLLAVLKSVYKNLSHEDLICVTTKSSIQKEFHMHSC